MQRNVVLTDWVGTRVVACPGWPYGNEDCGKLKTPTSVYPGTIVSISEGMIYVVWDDNINSHGSGYVYCGSHLLIYEEVQPIINIQNNQTDGKSIISAETTTVHRGKEQVYRSVKCSVEGTVIKGVNDQNRRITSTG